MTASDSELVERLADGDEAALAELYDRHAGMLTGLARRFLPGEPEADDLVHDVFLEAWRRAASFDPERGSVRSWLALMIRSRALDRIRKAERRLRAPMPTTPRGEIPAPSRGIEARRLAKSLEDLSPEQRSIVEMTYFAGLTSREIAERLDVPVGTVKSRLRSALVALRRDVASRVS